MSAEKPNFLLHSTCSEVKSNSRGGASVPFFADTSVTVNGAFRTVSRNFSPSSLLVNLPLVELNVVSRYTVFSSQYGSGLKFSISSCRFTMSANVGVCTLPIESTCLFCPYFKVYRRVAFMPSTQSPMARLSPASYSG